jgi:hypothetical protein
MGTYNPSPPTLSVVSFNLDEQEAGAKSVAVVRREGRDREKEEGEGRGGRKSLTLVS